MHQKAVLVFDTVRLAATMNMEEINRDQVFLDEFLAFDGVAD
jgi:hypothetical protein